MRKILLLSCTILLLAFSQIFAQTGKIAGTITDAKTGEALIGVNVVVLGTTIGAPTDLDGYYTINNMTPATYTLKISYLGYTTQQIKDIRVNIGETTIIDVQLQEQSLKTDEIVVTAARTPIIQQDKATSGVNLNAKEIQSLPVSNVSSVVSLQAGVEGGTIRGGSGDEIVYQVNGVTMKDGRDNTPYSNISMTSVQQIKVQTGGFTAETGDARSGVVEIVTKEGDKDKYTVSLFTQVSPAANKHFGMSINDPNSYFMRPYLDDDVCWTGTDNGNWDEYTKKQYPGFDGWNAISKSTLENDDPTDDLTPEAARRLFLWQHRKTFDIDKPDYDIDLSIGGPVPLISKQLGDLRFLASFKTKRDMLLIPLSTEDYRDYDAGIKLTSDLMPGMKLMVEGHIGEQQGTNTSTSGYPGIFSGDSYVAERSMYGSYDDASVFANDYWTPTKTYKNSISAKLTHAVDSKTFYQVIFNTFGSKYETFPGEMRDTTRRYKFGNYYYVDEAPYGYWQGGDASVNGSGMMMGSIYSQSRDTSEIRTYSLKVDASSQINKNHEVKAGIEIKVTDFNANFGIISEMYSTKNRFYRWDNAPIQGALYVQDKLEFEAMVCNIGVRMDYSNPNIKWYQYGQYDPSFSTNGNIDTLSKKSVPAQITFSPRLGVSFPITVNSKLFFNYGHFRSLPTPTNMYLKTEDPYGKLTYIANPNVEMEQTIAYEVGYEHNLFDQFLVRATGYYKDIKNESRDITYYNYDQSVGYTKVQPVQYRDIRGAEFQITKNRGDWVRGFINYTYMLSSSGKFGWGRYYELPNQQKEYIETDGQVWAKQSKSVARPYARMQLDIFTPNQFGPEVAGIYPLEGWSFNFLTTWKAGSYTSWSGSGVVTQATENNLQWKDYWNVDLRITKSLDLGPVELQGFVQIYNLFNFKRLSTTGFSSSLDRYNYYKSLHFPNSKGKDFNYINVPGDDQLGDYRKTGVEFIPIETSSDINTITDPVEKRLYYDAATQTYYEYSAKDGWDKADAKKVNYVLDNKAYIDNPDYAFFSFLGKRDIYFGLKLNVSL